MTRLATIAKSNFQPFHKFYERTSADIQAHRVFLGPEIRLTNPKLPKPSH